MPDTGAPWTIPYSAPSDAPDDPSQSKAWADTVAARLTSHNNSLTTASGNITTLQGQLTTLNTNMNKEQIWTAASTVSFSASQVSAPRTLTIPAAVFTQVPIILCQSSDIYYVLFRTEAVSLTSVTVSGYLSGPSTSTMAIFLLGVNYTATGTHMATALEPPPRHPDYGAAFRSLVTCDNPGCPAELETVEVWTYAGADIGCGSCGLDITDLDSMPF